MTLLPLVRHQLLAAARRLASMRRLARGLRLWRWLVLAAIVNLLSGCGGSSNWVAKVGGQSITPATFRHWVPIVAAEGGERGGAVPLPPHYTGCVHRLSASEAKRATAKKTASLESRCAARYKILKQEALGFLIPADWLLAEAQHLGVKVSDAEVKQQFISARTSKFPHAREFEQFLRTSAYTVSDLLLRVKVNMVSLKIEQAIVKKHKTATEAEVAKYFNENKSRFGVPEKRAVYIILTKTEAAANSAKKEVESGKSFADVAKKVSIDPTSKTTGGLLPEVTKGEEEKPLDEQIFSAKTGVLSGPVKTTFGYYIFQVKSVSPGSQKTLAQVKKQVKAQLVSSNESKALQAFTKDFKKSWTAKTECRDGYKISDCKGYKAPRGG